jgi:LDH2 family malate/lactate/ureidoglycolate dehydrogenase
MVEVLRATPSVKQDEPVLIPGDPEWSSRRERKANGIPLPDSLVETIRDIARAAGADTAL